jgi:parvulin-like peptidyl-prolyl isomerase
MIFTSRAKKIKQGLKINKLLLILILSLIVIIVLTVGTICWGVYKLKWQGEIIDKILSVVPLPVARVDNNFILSTNYLESLRVAQRFYQKQREAKMPNIPTDQEIKKIIMEDRMIENLLVKEIAKKYNITVTKQEINDKLEELSKNKGSVEEVNKFLLEYYGIDAKKYKKIFIEPNLYYDKANMAILNDQAINGEKINKINEALQTLKNGEDFEKTAQQYTEEEDPLGNKITQESFLRGELPKDIEDQLFNMIEGNYTDVLKLQDGLIIVKLIKKDIEKGVLSLGKIVVKIRTIKDLIKDQKEKAQIKIYAY